MQTDLKYCIICTENFGYIIQHFQIVCLKKMNKTILGHWSKTLICKWRKNVTKSVTIKELPPLTHWISNFFNKVILHTLFTSTISVMFIITQVHSYKKSLCYRHLQFIYLSKIIKHMQKAVDGNIRITRELVCPGEYERFFLSMSQNASNMVMHPCQVYISL